jgi:hypothetical protein
MMILLGLIFLVVAVCVALLGLQGIGLPTGRLFLIGIEVGVVGMVGLRLVRGDIRGRRAARRLRRLHDRSLNEITEVIRDRDRLALELREIRAKE